MQAEYTSTEDRYGFRKCCEAVNAAAPILEVAGRYTQPRRVGYKYVARCPLGTHADLDPSFYLDPEKNSYRCYGCGEWGDVIDLEFHCGPHGELWEAMIDLALDYKVELPSRSETWGTWQNEKGKRREMICDVLTRQYQRRYFRVYGGHLENIANLEERRAEAERFFNDLYWVARHAARWRMSQ